MSMPFGQLVSCNQYSCNDVYRCYLLWRSSGSKFIHVLVAHRPTTVPFVWYYLLSAKCVCVCCWRAPTLLYRVLTLSSHNIDIQCRTHPSMESFGSVPQYYVDTPLFFWHPLLFVMFFINFVDLINLPFVFASCINPNTSVMCRLGCCCHQNLLMLLSGTLYFAF